MSLWLEERDESGKVIAVGKASDGMIRVKEENDFLRHFSVEEAIKLCKLSSHLPVEQRQWVLRIRSDRPGAPEQINFYHQKDV